jgi:hypothetical protein
MPRPSYVARLGCLCRTVGGRLSFEDDMYNENLSAKQKRDESTKLKGKYGKLGVAFKLTTDTCVVVIAE